MVKIAAFVIAFSLIFVCVGIGFSVGNSDFRSYYPDIYGLFSEYVDEALFYFNDAFLNENPVVVVYDLFHDDEITTFEAVCAVIPAAIVSGFDFITQIGRGLYAFFVKPLVNSKPITVNTTPYA